MLRRHAITALLCIFAGVTALSFAWQFRTALLSLDDPGGRTLFESSAAGYRLLKYGIPRCEVADYVSDAPEETQVFESYVAASVIAPQLVDVFKVTSSTNRYVVARFFHPGAYERYVQEHAVRPLLNYDSTFCLFIKE